MQREGRRRKFHEAVLSTLYPETPPQPEYDNKPESAPGELFDVEAINPEDFVKSDFCTSEDETEHQKLSRAQRKRLRKKKLKEESSRRGKLIGPLLPPSTSNDGDLSNITGNESEAGENAEEHDDPQSVRQNASEKPEEKSGCSNQNKLKQRRMAKRLGKERFDPTRAENCGQAESFKSSDAELWENSESPMILSSRTPLDRKQELLPLHYQKYLTKLLFHVLWNP